MQTEANVPAPTKPAPKEDEGFYAAYKDFASNLRIWFLAYGIGTTAVFVTNESAASKLLDSGYAPRVAYLLLIGVAIQVFVALLYKSSMWFLYTGEVHPDKKNGWVYKFADKVSSRYWPEFICDLATVVSFAGATWFLINVFLRFRGCATTA